MPKMPVVKRSIIASCILIVVRIIEDRKSTAKPRDILKTEATAIGSVLNGLRAKPIVGRNTGAA